MGWRSCEPKRMMEPFPYWRSTWLSAVSSALCLLSAPAFALLDFVAMVPPRDGLVALYEEALTQKFLTKKNVENSPVCHT